MKVAIAADHAGYEYKAALLARLATLGYEVADLGAHDTAPSDYPDHATHVAKAIQSQQCDRGILICGSGVGVSIAANKFKGIRAGVCHDTYSAHQCVEHDDANVICIGQRVVGIELMYELVEAFLAASFTREVRHMRRVGKVALIEEQNMK